MIDQNKWDGMIRCRLLSTSGSLKAHYRACVHSSNWIVELINQTNIIMVHLTARGCDHHNWLGVRRVHPPISINSHLLTVFVWETGGRVGTGRLDKISSRFFFFQYVVAASAAAVCRLRVSNLKQCILWASVFSTTVTISGGFYIFGAITNWIHTSAKGFLRPEQDNENSSDGTAKQSRRHLSIGQGKEVCDWAVVPAPGTDRNIVSVPAGDVVLWSLWKDSRRVAWETRRGESKEFNNEHEQFIVWHFHCVSKGLCLGALWVAGRVDHNVTSIVLTL